jgi:hypothetical protein
MSDEPSAAEIEAWVAYWTERGRRHLDYVQARIDEAERARDDDSKHAILDEVRRLVDTAEEKAWLESLGEYEPPPRPTLGVVRDDDDTGA